MHRDRDFDLQQELPRHQAALVQDLELGTLLRAMADDDELVHDVAQRALLLGPENDLDTIPYRQEVAKDCLENPAVIRALYDLAAAAIDKHKSYFGFFTRYPAGILRDSIDVMQIFTEALRELRGIADAHAGEFASLGFAALFAMLQKELDDEYLASIREHLTELKLDRGALLSAELGSGNQGTNYVLRLPHRRRRNWLKRILDKGPPAFTYRLPERDEAGARALGELRDRGINRVATALAQSTDHVLSFFVMLRAELAFYVGGLNLRDKLAQMGAPICFARPEPAGSRRLHGSGLYDVSLALTMGRSPVGNAVDGDGRDLVIVTGANQGGKSSFLRSIGQAQLMMQAGMFVGAESFAVELCSGLFTHHKREEDATMTRGKLDEELGRMSDIVETLRPNSMLLFNESFASTNEREGSEIARQIVRALLEKGIKVFFVTHLYEFARGCFDRKLEALFLRAERQADGTRTFKLVEGEPLSTSYGGDLYREIFAVE
jgi:hypothetical protein